MVRFGLRSTHPTAAVYGGLGFWGVGWGWVGVLPMGGIDALGDEAVDAGVLPVLGKLAESVFDGVVVDVIAMVGKVGFVANSVFPKSSLPQITFAASLWGSGEFCLCIDRAGTAPGDEGFNESPPRGIVGISRR